MKTRASTSRSRFGVRISALPSAPIVSHRWSSARINKMLGPPSAAQPHRPGSDTTQSVTMQTKKSEVPVSWVKLQFRSSRISLLLQNRSQCEPGPDYAPCNARVPRSPDTNLAPAKTSAGS